MTNAIVMIVANFMSCFKIGFELLAALACRNVKPTLAEGYSVGAENSIVATGPPQKVGGSPESTGADVDALFVEFRDCLRESSADLRHDF